VLRRSFGIVLFAAVAFAFARDEALSSASRSNSSAIAATQSCFLLQEVGSGEVRRNPADGCTVRVAPMSTFKIPHALAGLDSGILAGADTVFRDDGAPVNFTTWRGDQSLKSAMRNSVVWYFQRLAEQLGAAREREYLKKLDYGNADPSSGLTTFWLGGSLAISPEEQLRFLQRLYANDLPVSAHAMQVVREILIQPSGVITNASGEHAFAAPWPKDLVLSAKTGSGSFGDGRDVRWIVGHVRRASRSWMFVSCVTGDQTVAPLAAVELAASRLRAAKVW
jgi:beta-lactamase class D